MHAHFGPMIPPMISNPRKAHAKREVGAVENGWLHQTPFFKTPIKQSGFVAPMGSLDGIEHFLARVETIKRLTDQQRRDAEINRVLIEQDRELPTIVDEFRANGFRAVSLSSSSLDEYDDDIEPADQPIKAPPAYGVKSVDEFGVTTYYDAEEAAAIERRIEWERYMLACSLPKTIRLVPTEDGRITAEGSPGIEPESVIALGRRLRTACGFATPDELENARTRARHYGVVGSILYGKTKGAQWPEQSLDVLGAEDLEKPEEVLQGPQELGLHWLSSDLEDSIDPEGLVLPEPSDSVLEQWTEAV